MKPSRKTSTNVSRSKNMFDVEKLVNVNNLFAALRINIVVFTELLWEVIINFITYKGFYSICGIGFINYQLHITINNL